jgi:hypothetical protein
VQQKSGGTWLKLLSKSIHHLCARFACFVSLAHLWP